VWDDDRRTGDEPWYDNQPLVLASGVAGLLLVGLLVFSVIQVSHGSVDSPDLRLPDTSETTAETSYTTSTTTTSYLPPSVQTSEFGPPPAAPPPPDAPPPDGGDQPIPNDAPSTIYNPYAPTTTAGSAGHI
jgi:hypothetical protein